MTEPRRGKSSVSRAGAPGAPDSAGAASGGARRIASHAAAALALGVAVGATYAGALDAGFTLDADAIVRRAPRVHAATWENVAEILTTDYWWPLNMTGTHRPLTTLSFLFEWSVAGFGDRPAGYHATNLALHALNAVLVYALGVAALGLAAPIAFLGALLFATHPVATEAVTNVVGRADLLATASVLAAVALWARAARRAPSRARRVELAGVGVVAALGLLAKESAVVLPLAIALWDLLFRFPSRPPSRERPLARIAALARDWLWLAPPLVAVALLRWWALHGHPATEVDFAQNSLAAAGPLTARATALALIARALGLLLWPARLCPDYSVNEIPLFAWGRGAGDWLSLAGLAVLAAAIALAVRVRGRAPAVAFAIGLFLIALLPSSNLLFPIGAVFAERFLYLPLAPFALLAAVAAAAAVRRAAAALVPGERSARTALALTCVLVVAVAAVLAARSARRNLDWRDDVTLWQAATESCPASYKSWQGLAAALGALPPGDPRAAGVDRVVELQGRAVGILEANAPAGTEVPAFVLERLGAFELEKMRLEARREAGGESPPGAAAAWAARAAATLERAVAEVDRETAARRAAAGHGALELGTPRLHLDRGAALLQLGRADEALASFARARRLLPNGADVHLSASAANAALGRDEAALVDTLQALLVDPARVDLQPRILALYERIDPGGCGFTRQGDRVAVHPECPAARRIVCRAYAELERTLAGATNFPPAEREAAIARFRQGATGYRCAELGPREGGAAS